MVGFGSLVQFLIVILAARAAGALAVRLRQPAVLGELLAGVAAGLLPFFDPSDRLLALAAQAGVALLLFETGLESDPKRLLKAGVPAAAVAVTGVVLPFVLGWGVMTAAGRGGLEAVFVGGALTATSVGITVRVLRDLGRLSRPEADVVLGAAVIDDVLGLLLLAFVAGAAHAAASGFIVAAFVAGLAFSGRSPKALRAAVAGASWALVPVFFLVCGSAVKLPALGGEGAVLAAALVAAAVAGKALCGWAARAPGLDRWAIGAAMIPRGEVGLVFAQLGAASGAVSEPVYAALVAVVAVTTFLAPPLIKRTFGD